MLQWYKRGAAYDELDENSLGKCDELDENSLEKCDF